VAYTVKADMWSVGVTACELLAAKAPFGRPSDYKGKIDCVLQNIRDYRRFKDIEKRLSKSQSWESRSNQAKEFVESLIIADPADRYHADQALEHYWLTKHQGTPESLSSEMMGSMARFVGASYLMRRCLLIIAARVGSPKMERIGRVFTAIDHQHTGRISREELAAAVSASAGASCWEAEMDVDDFFDAADQDRRNVVTFLEFAATGLWGTDDTTNTIAERVFKALDDNHDGKIDLRDFKDLFRDNELMELRNLPMDRAVGINEWRVAVGGNDEPLSKPKEQPKGSYLANFLRALICSEDNPGADDSYEAVCR